MRQALAIAVLGFTAAAVLAPVPAPAQPAGAAAVGEIRGLKLGVKAEEMEEDAFGEFACGGNGGAPLQKITGWGDFKRCRAEPSGLREVWVRYADHNELYARATENEALVKRMSGTRVAGQLIILSVLFDDQGVSRGIRMITDPRAPVGERRAGHMFRLTIFQRYGGSGWNCTELPAAEGESPVAGVWVKLDCEKKTPERHLFVQSRFLRKAGQHDLDPVTREPGIGQFESSTRFEIYDPTYARG